MLAPPWILSVYDSVVTGAAGFIGSHLAERLVDRGDRVLGIDSFDSYYPRRAKLRNLAHLTGSPRFELRRADLRRIRLERHLAPGTTVYHLAGQPGVRGSWGSRFDQYADNNILATQALLEGLARAGGRNRLVYGSSSSIYGVQPSGAMGEEAVPNPISPYGMTKLAAEHLGRAYARAHSLPFVALRFFTVYGPRQRPDMAFHRFFRAARAGRPLQLFGTGRQLRDFTYVSDTVDGLVRAGAPGGPVGTFNLGRGSPVRLMAAMREIQRIVGSEVPLERGPRPAGDPDVTWADIRRATKAFGYRPRVELAEGLRHQWAWHERQGPYAAG